MNNNKKQYLFITGMARSGTTLLDKLLGSHATLGILSQPFPHLYRHIKRSFFEKIGHSEKYYVLNNLFMEGLYTAQDLKEFLNSYQLDRSLMISIFNEMREWSGQYTKIENTTVLTEGFKSTRLEGCYKFLLERLNYNPEATILGAKETLAEEFVPYYLNHGIKVILVIRDPRDVYTSLNFGRGTDFGGSHRPSLFHLRNWRKSIAIANTFRENTNFLTIKYEDLLADQELNLKKVTDFLEINPFPKNSFTDGIPLQNGEKWLGNSSTSPIQGIDINNSSKYLKYLEPETLQYIEYICGPEMSSWGYKKDFEDSENDYDPSRFKEPFPIEVDNLDINMSSDNRYLKEESQRRSWLNGETVEHEHILSCFYSIQNYNILKFS